MTNLLTMKFMFFVFFFQYQRLVQVSGDRLSRGITHQFLGIINCTPLNEYFWPNFFGLFPNVEIEVQALSLAKTKMKYFAIMYLLIPDLLS